MKSILIIGSLNMDASVRTHRLPVKGETVNGESVSFIPGGKGANQAAAAGRLAAVGSVSMIGCVGADSFGDELKESLRQSQVDVAGVCACENCSTGFAVVAVDSNGHNQIIVIPGSNALCNTEYIRSMDAMLQRADYVILQMEIPEPAVYDTIRRAKALGKTVILNPAPAPEHIPQEILAMVDYLTPNETELMYLAGREGNQLKDYIQAARTFVEAGTRNVVVTLGSQGALVVNKELCQVVPGQKTAAVDTVAAGDCFNAAMVVAMSEGRSLLEAVSFANKAAAISVSRKGAQSSLPWRREIED